MRSISSEQLKNWGLSHIQGPLKASASQISIPEDPKTDSLVFLKTGGHIMSWVNIRILVLDQSVDPKGLPIPEHITVFQTVNFRAHMGQALAVFDTKELAFPSGISSRADVHPTATLAPGARIAPGAVIGESARIGADVWIGSNAVIEAFAQIGDHSRIHSGAVIGHHCVIGNHCEIHSNTSIGSDGFGFIPQKNSHPVKIPQIGRVVLDPHVEVGANCAIDRGAIGDTFIGAGTKIDNLCHIAHNCRIGQDGLIAAGFMVAGSSNIGDRFACGGSVVVADHITITNDVSLGGRSTVTKDITASGAYAGYPLQPMKEALKSLASIRELPRLRKDIQAIRRHLNLEQGADS